MSREPATSDHLNDNHLRHIYATCQHIDRLLATIESMVGAPVSGALFHRFEQTLSPDARAALLDGIVQIRAAIKAALARHGIGIPPPVGDVAWNIRSTLGFIDLDIEEIRPGHMGGYGPVGPQAAADLDSMAAELRRPLAKLTAFLDPDQASDDGGRHAP